MSDEETTADETADDETPAEAPAGRYGGVEGADGVLHTDVEGYLAVATAARADGFDQLIDLTAVDYLTFAAPRGLPAGHEAQRFEVVTALINHESGERIRIRVQVPGDEPIAPSLFDLWPGAEALEREVYDMFGIEFAEHPDMSRILMPEDWIGHPLRKDYAVGSIPVQFKAASNIR
ncbi:MAG: NADH-quinone oxidoreductase subunit C [Acidimicrobiales bacterium]|nr:NADH-quinone oxidoreductase subunit C [Acidimicrobiales bacterium]